MNRCRVVAGLVSLLAVAAIIASCGGSDSDGESGAAPESTAAESTESADDQATSDDTSTEDEAPTTDAESEDEADDASQGAATPNCDAIFSMAEMEEFFAEPVELTEETDENLGQLVCTWESIEDPDDLEDLAFQLLVVQFYSGSPIEASSFFDPSVLEPVTNIDGVGDVAYTTDEAGMDYVFLDDPVGGSLSYMAVDMGDAEAQPPHTSADVEQLFRTFHDRVT